MKRKLVALLLAGALALGTSAVALADAHAPTNGGSANGGGASGQCTGDLASRPPSCHNTTGADGN